MKGSSFGQQINFVANRKIEYSDGCWRDAYLEIDSTINHQFGFAHVESGPLVRSSYHADGQLELIRRRAQPAVG